MVMVVIAAAALGSCSGSAGAESGTALKADGPPAVGLLGIPDAKIGVYYGFSFPLLVNSSGTTLRVDSFSLENVPRGAKVTGYPVYSMKDTDGYLLDTQYGDPATVSEPDMANKPNYAGKPIVIRSHKDSGDYYTMVKVKVVGHISKHLSGCRVNYTQRGKQYTQLLHCEYALDMK